MNYIKQLFNNLTQGYRENQERKKLAREGFENARQAIAAKDVKLLQETLDDWKGYKTEQARTIILDAIKTDNTEMFEPVFKSVLKGNPNHLLYDDQMIGPEVYYYSVEPVFYAALRMRSEDIALYLLDKENIDVTKGAFDNYSRGGISDKSMHLSPVELAARNGMTKTVEIISQKLSERHLRTARQNKSKLGNSPSL